MILAFGGLGPKSESLASAIAPNSVQSELLSLAHDLELPSYKVVAGICDSRDLAFIKAKAPALRKELIRDRSRLARLWLKENRRDLSQLLRLHRLIERTSQNLSVLAEFQIAAAYVSLQFLLLVAELVVIAAGPFHARLFGLYAMSAFDRLSAAVAMPISTLDVTKKAVIRADWARVP
jgi:hypothetical protein